ncbi:hypothetical protein [Micromonospora coerulea]|uniref:hypothetical protein n=1 Tax=Micromonospora coerulea TaxID=47856 RepID=UPI0031F7E4B4
MQVPAGLTAAPYDVPRHLNLPAGWSASVYVRAAKPRFMAPTPAGDLLLSQPSRGAVLLIRKCADGTGQASEFLTGLNRPHDIVFADVAGRIWIFVAEADRVVRYPYGTGDRPGPGEVVADGLPDTSIPELRGQYAHVLKNIAVRDGRLYVSIASTCNVCGSDTRSDPQRCACRKSRPYRSSGMSVLVEDAAEAITSADVEVVESVRFGDRLGERA